MPHATSIDCPKCGADLAVGSEDRDARCSYCGNRFAIRGVTAPAGDPEPQSRRLNAVFGVAVILSVLTFVGVGIAALVVYPKWESEVLMWIALVGAPGTLAAIVRPIYRALLRS